MLLGLQFIIANADRDREEEEWDKCRKEPHNCYTTDDLRHAVPWSYCVTRLRSCREPVSVIYTNPSRDTKDAVYLYGVGYIPKSDVHINDAHMTNDGWRRHDLCPYPICYYDDERKIVASIRGCALKCSNEMCESHAFQMSSFSSHTQERVYNGGTGQYAFENVRNPFYDAQKSREYTDIMNHPHPPIDWNEINQKCDNCKSCFWGRLKGLVRIVAGWRKPIFGF